MMKKEVVFISLSSFFFTVVFCFVWGEIQFVPIPTSTSTPKEKTQISPQELPEQIIQKQVSSSVSPQYKKWKELGKKAEREKRLADAIRFYSWALSFEHDIELEKRIDKLTATTQKSNQRLLSKYEMWKKALYFENNQLYREALELYEKLEEINAFPNKIKERIEYCRTKMRRKKQSKNMFFLANQLTSEGKFEEALNVYRKLISLSPQRSKEKIVILQKMKKYHEKVEKKVRILIRQKRYVYAYRYISHESLNKNYFAKKIYILKREIKKRMTYVSAGNFIFGSDDYKDEAPQKTVYLDAFYINKYEVTNEEYFFYIKATRRTPPNYWINGMPSETMLSLPVTNVSWKDALLYCQWMGVRLPTEQQWEKAARGEKGNIYPWGNTFLPNCANTQETKTRGLSSVGRFSSGKSPYGCYDMIGNASEWTLDAYDSYEGNPHFLFIPPGHKVVRGGSRNYKGSTLYCSKRSYHKPNAKLLSIGFRCVIDAKKLGMK